jgi:hypothetical protein
MDPERKFHTFYMRISACNAADGINESISIALDTLKALYQLAFPVAG